MHVDLEYSAYGFVVKSFEFVHVLLCASPGFAPPESDVDRNCEVDEVFCSQINVLVFEELTKSAHALRCLHDTEVDLRVFAQVGGDCRPEVAE